MVATLQPEMNPDQPMVYQIRVRSHLGFDWTDWFDGLTITLEENGDMLLTGPVVDQSALHGLLKKVRNLGIPLVSVNPVQINESGPKDENENEYRQMDQEMLK